MFKSAFKLEFELLESGLLIQIYLIHLFYYGNKKIQYFTYFNAIIMIILLVKLFFHILHLLFL